MDFEALDNERKFSMFKWLMEFTVWGSLFSKEKMVR